MALVSNDTIQRDFIVHIGAPKPIMLQYAVDGVLQSWPSTIRFRCNTRGTLINKTSGSGITLSDAEGVDDATATIQLTVADSRTIPVGRVTAYEITDGAAAEQPIIMGYLIGRGGNNSDV